MKASIAVLLVVIVAAGVLAAVYFLSRPTGLYGAAPSASSSAAPPLREKIELEKIFTQTAACEECGLSTLD